MQVEYPSPKYAWWVVTVLLTTYTLSYVDRMILSLLVRPIKTDLGLSDTQISLLIGIAFAALYLIMTVPLGQMADRFNRRSIIMAGVSVWSLATAGCGLAPNFLFLALARTCVGIGEATMAPCAFSIVADVFPRAKLARAASVFSMGVPIGTAIALIFGGIIFKAASAAPITLPYLGQMAPWRIVFMLLLLPGVMVVGLLFTVREPERRDVRGADRAGYRELFAFMNSKPGVWSILIGMALFFTASQGVLPWLPTFFERTYGIPIKDTSLIIGMMTAICGIPALFTGGHIADMWLKRGRTDGHVIVMIASAVAVIPALTLAPLASTPNLAYTGLGLQTFFTFMPIGVATAAIQMVTPNRLRGQMAACTMLLFGFSALAVGPTLIALFTDYVFHDDSALRYSLSIVGAIMGPLAAIVLGSAKRPFRRTVENLNNETTHI